ncbi:MAG: methionyl-tRNA formyltransferase [Proteobacteria bacterium]|nr:methionyl-tRNA formyltransferase [Pseudomonadota bacterium]
MRLRVAFAGTPGFAVPALEALCAAHEVVGVLTQPDRPAGRGRHLTESPVKQAARARALPLAQPSTLRSAQAQAALAAWAPEVLVVVAYGLLLPPEVLSLPRRGCLNIHASLLPRWRGAAPVQRAILAGDVETGVTIMQMDEGLDTGPVLLTERTLISRAHTGGSLHDELSVLGARLLIEALTGLERGTLEPVAQSADGVSYAAKIGKAEAVIDWQRDALSIERQVRAFNPWPVAQTQLEGETLRVFAAHADENDDIMPANDAKNTQPGSILDVQDGFMRVRCGSGTLSVTQVQRPGRRAMSVGEFAHGQALAGRRLG